MVGAGYGRRQKRRYAAVFPGGSHPSARDEGEVRWLISYSDFMMQLVCLFILLYSVSSLDPGKAAQISQAWREETGLEEVRAPATPGASSLPLTMTEMPAALGEIRIVLARHPDGGLIRVSPRADGFVLQIVAELFEEGSSRPTPPGRRIIELAAETLRPLQPRARSIEIVGHASAGDAEREAGSALALSLSRAREAHAGVRGILDRGPLLAGGRGAHDPVADAADPEARRMNRRVDFRVRLQEPAIGVRR
jgi:flagellar motor protein MotB